MKRPKISVPPVPVARPRKIVEDSFALVFGDHQHEDFGHPFYGTCGPEYRAAERQLEAV